MIDLQKTHLENTKITINSFVEQILNDLIDEQVVLTQAEGLGIKFTDEELRNAVLEFKSDFPEIYKHGVHLYGEAEYNKGIERQKIYKAVFQHIVNKKVSNSIKNDFIHL